MPNWSADLLEYEGLRSLLGRYVSSPAGRAELERMAPTTDRAFLENSTAELSEALLFLGEGDSDDNGVPRIRFTELEDVSEAVARIRIEGAVLDGLEILAVRQWLTRATEFRLGLASAPHRYPLLWQKAVQLADFRPLLRALDGKIRPDGGLEDDASVALKRLRVELQRQKVSIQDSLERFLKAHRDDGVVQEEFITLRNERFVVPVATNFKGRVQGVMHGGSNSGQTMFLEPMETIQLNNEMVRLIDEELRECHRIFRELTARMREQHREIALAIQIMGQLEFVFAKARFGADFHCTIPEYSPEGSRKLVLKKARHPLLQDVLRKKRATPVPLNLEMDEIRRTLLISGPNTGGKTVAMKTVGLLALMAQSALPVPAAEAVFPLYDQVLADIGDNQSIESSLSSFSSHIRHVAELLEQVSPDSLVILDEIGRATDPEEGGALGVAIVDRFHRDGCFTLASTHLIALKIYGVNHEGVLSAAMGFEEATLLPTFELKVGAPGKSAGLDTAARFGILPEVIEAARNSLTTREQDISRFLNELHAKLESATALEAACQQKEVALRHREKELEERYLKREAQRLKEIEAKTAKLLADFERGSRETIADMEQAAEQRKAGDQARLKAAKFKREFQAEVQSALRPEGQAAAPKGPQLEVGVKVRLEGVRELAQVLRLLDNGRVEVQAGFMKMQVARDEVLEVVGNNTEKARRLPDNVRFEPGPTWDTPTREINVIGQRMDEAVDNVDRFLDKASLASIVRIRVVHGHGFGVLKKAIHDMLSKNPHVARHYPATPAEGGAGATIVELRA
jgi:DNA mismatch repair protein MutS2